jgi:hypothetical protein
MPISTESPGNAYQSLLAINGEAFAGAHYEVAYHALAAALHCAVDESDRERMRDVQAIAGRQRDWIDQFRPEHRLSTASARARGQQSMFAMLERQASAAGHILPRRNAP